MKKKSFILGITSALVLSGAMIVSAISIPNSGVETLAVEGNDTSAFNVADFSSTAVTIDYTGEQTGFYSLQGYAGISGPNWVNGDNAPYASSGHCIGSNHDEPGSIRDGLCFTFSINSSVTEKAYLGIMGRTNEWSAATVKVNNDEPFAFNLGTVVYGHPWCLTSYSMIEVNLVAGVNTITVTMGENYTCWVGTWFVCPTPRHLDANGVSDTLYCDGDAMNEEALPITYDPLGSTIYSMQGYAGVSGDAWVTGMGDLVSSVVNDGSTARKLGSGADKPETTFTFKVNTDKATKAVMKFYTEYYAQKETYADLVVNGADAVRINLYDLHGGRVENSDVATHPTLIPNIELKEGENTITLKMLNLDGAKWCIWSHGFTFVDSERITVESSDITIEVGQDYSLDSLVVTKTVADGSTSTLTPDDYTVETPQNYDKNVAGTYRFTVISNTDNTKKAFFNVVVVDPRIPHETVASNMNCNSFAPVLVDYNGTYTGTYGFQAFGGFSDAQMWIMGYTVDADFGTGHAMGSNNGDGRKGLNLLFRVNSSVAGKANLLLFAEFYNDQRNSQFVTPTVNGVAGEEFNLTDLSKQIGSSGVKPTRIPVTLVEGNNLISLKFRAETDYNIWMKNFAFEPYSETEKLPSVYEANLEYISSFEGAFTPNYQWVGINAQDSATDYGKTGKVSIKFNVETADRYLLKFYVQQGDPRSDKLSIWVDGVLQTFDGQDYIHLHQDGQTWDGDRWTPGVSLNLTAGDHTLTFGNKLSYVNKDNFDISLNEGDENAVGISNFHIHNMKFEREIRPVSISLATSEFEIDYDGIFDRSLVVPTATNNDGTTVELPANAYKIVMAENFDETVSGTYTNKVVLVADESIFTTFTVTVKENPVPPTSEDPEPTSEEPVSETPTSVAPVSEAPVSEAAPSETPATSEEKKGGCGGSIAATCGIVALLSTLGVAVVALKKKEN